MNSAKQKNEWEQDIQDVMNQEPLEDHDFKEKNKQSTQSVQREEEKQSAS
jgi:hypothetical protein